MPPLTRYARSGDVHLAYQVLGEGPLDLVYVHGWVPNVEYGWEVPPLARFLSRPAAFSRLILFDRRGTGMSDRVPDRELLTLEERMEDIRTVMDAAGSARAAIFGVSEGGGPARAVRCARAIRDAVAGLELSIRAGLHTGASVKSSATSSAGSRFTATDDLDRLGDEIAALAAHLAGCSLTLRHCGPPAEPARSVHPGARRGAPGPGLTDAPREGTGRAGRSGRGASRPGANFPLDTLCVEWRVAVPALASGSSQRAAPGRGAGLSRRRGENHSLRCERPSGGFPGARNSRGIVRQRRRAMPLATRFTAPPTATDDLDRLGDEIAALAAHLDAATARFLTLLRDFDARGGWANGCRSCAEWLAWRAGLDPGAARERVRVARALGGLPRLAAALARGEVSYSKVRALTRVATPETEVRLLEVARAGTAAQVERIVRAWRRVDAQGEDAAARHERRSLQVYPDEDGTFVVRGRLEPEVGALLVRALEAAGEKLYARGRAAGTASEAEPPTHGQRQADALALVAETALAHGLDPGAEASERYQVVVHVDTAVLADPAEPGQSALEDAVHVSAETSRRLACDATRVVMRHAGDGRVLDVGRRTRVIPPALRRALQARDRGCRFPGCTVRHAQGHHVHHWANGGATRLDNLALLCRRHHRAVHEEGYAVERASDGTLSFRTPAGRPIPEVPAAPAVSAEPARALVAGHRALGFRIHGWTGCPTWGGERLDLDWAIGVLHPAATAAPRHGAFRLSWTNPGRSGRRPRRRSP